MKPNIKLKANRYYKRSFRFSDYSFAYYKTDNTHIYIIALSLYEKFYQKVPRVVSSFDDYDCKNSTMKEISETDFLLLLL